ncbi:hypothetical protein [Alkalicoccus chagannorensis]|uniref:hypothetical protein n=1 Tax=Alkalicoccus chagannorensis TaxID=427072 RepID=UPI0004170597|nr:hypothetical protein [Alkalicoccus chagannorensis]
MTDPGFFINIYSQILFIAWLATAGGIFWGLDKRAGFQLLYLTVVSLTLSYIIVMYFPYLDLGNENVPVTHPHVQATVTLFSFLLPLCRTRLQTSLCVASPAVVSMFYLLVQGVPAFTIAGGILIGGFISYTYYHSLEWIGAMPDLYLFLLAIILPFFLSLLIYPQEYFLLLPGLLLGIGVGATLEQYKIRMNLEQTRRRSKFICFAVGAAGIIFVMAGVRPAFEGFMTGELITGVFTGLWITLIVPFMMIVSQLYEQFGNREQVFHHSTRRF